MQYVRLGLYVVTLARVPSLQQVGARASRRTLPPAM
jgi:hypothetical protein